MRFEPPENLVSLLGRLKLATADQVAAVARRAGRLAGDLPDFESVWVDALAQARILTPFQAVEINAGRGQSLRWGSYVITQAMGGPHWADCFAARHVDTRRPARLYVMRRWQETPAAAAALAKLVGQSTPLRSPAAAVVEDCGTSGGHAWAACAEVEGIVAAEWMVENGRFPPGAVLHVAREMVQRLADLELLGIIHGDLCAAGLLLQDSGHVVLPAPGLRGIVRPHEGYSFNDLRPEAYDYLAPERIAEGTAPTIASDVYACGSLWWHLLTGRAPFPGGNSLAKLKAVHAARVVDVRQLAPDVPDALAAALNSCLAQRPELRPRSFAELAERLGAPTRSGSALLAGVLWRPAQPWQVVRRSGRRERASRKTPWVAGVAAVSIVILGAIVPLLLRFGPRPGSAVSAHRQPTPNAAKQPDEENASAAMKHTADANPLPDVRVDRAVTPASATLPMSGAPLKDVVLSTDGMLHVEQLDLKPHVRVRGRAGGRPLVSVPRRGLIVECEDVTFEGIDFVWEDDRAPESAAPIFAGAMIALRAQTATFRGCSFSTVSGATPVAIAWFGADDGLPGLGSELSLRDGVFDSVAAVIDCQGTGGVSVTFDNVLCVDAGPLVRLHRGPRPDEPVALVLDHVTTRGDSAVLECRYGRLDDDTGSIAITANDSAFAGNPRWGLLMLSGAERPERLVASLAWRGQGSIVTPETAVLLWRAAGRHEQALSEEDVEVAGLVRSELEFAAAADGPASASRVTRWQVPLRSADPPGANTGSLSWPRR